MEHIENPQQDALLPVSLDEYREAIDKAGSGRRAALRRLNNTTEVLRLRVVAGVRAGLSQSEAAKLAGVRRQTVMDWVNQ